MNKTIGIFGGGQLGRMMAQAALPLNINVLSLKPVPIAHLLCWVR
jgi:5-(carboxyamino)imidazole ribonucleotide synthase